MAESALRSRELAGVLAALAAARIRPALVKGAALAHTVYPDPVCRPMGDLDLWVQSGEIAAAQAALEELGYVQRIKPGRPVALQAHRQGEIQLVGQAPGQGLVELHWGVFAGEWLQRAAAVPIEAVAARLQPAFILGYPVYTLAPGQLKRAASQFARLLHISVK